MANLEHIKIAKQGKDAWNKWRKTTDEPADFSSYDFRDDPIDFSWFVFGDNADFSGTKLGKNTSFESSSFGYWTNFDAACFNDEANFQGTQFNFGTSFDKTVFLSAASFIGTIFAGWASFQDTKFSGPADFTGIEKENWLQRQWKRHPTKISKDTFWKSREATASRANLFDRIDFSRALFERKAIFSGRRFENEIDLSSCTFRNPPIFDGTENHNRIAWKGASFDFRGFIKLFPFKHFTTDPLIPTQIRRLRKIAADIHDTDTERDLFILERAAERGVYWVQGRRFKAVWESLWFFFYWLTSDCGRSISRPVFSWGGINLAAYVWFRAHMDYSGNHDAVVSFAVGHSIPFLGALKASYRNAVKKIYGTDGVIPMDIMGVAMAQEVLSAVFIFLLLLALRNHFKIK